MRSQTENNFSFFWYFLFIENKNKLFIKKEKEIHQDYKKIKSNLNTSRLQENQK